jgi:hypothetical protein
MAICASVDNFTSWQQRRFAGGHNALSRRLFNKVIIDAGGLLFNAAGEALARSSRPDVLGVASEVVSQRLLRLLSRARLCGEFVGNTLVFVLDSSTGGAAAKRKFGGRAEQADERAKKVVAEFCLRESVLNNASASSKKTAIREIAMADGDLRKFNVDILTRALSRPEVVRELQRICTKSPYEVEVYVSSSEADFGVAKMAAAGDLVLANDGVEYPILLGLAHDFVGYIVPAYNYVLSTESPYLVEADGDHYEETYSLGPDVQRQLVDPILELVAWRPPTE